MTESNITIRFHNLPERVREQIAFIAKVSGCPKESIINELIVQQAEEMSEDLAIATERLNNPGEMISHEEARRILFVHD